MSALCSIRVTDCRPVRPVAYAVIALPLDPETIQAENGVNNVQATQQ
jgi:hypothetical protein